jgi:LPXTG-motif cell wall-anchored protein
MKRILLALGIALALPASAAAKGPHAILDSGPEGLDPGQPWVTTLQLIELPARQSSARGPSVVLRSGATRFTVRPRPIGRRQFGEVRYRLRVVFPHAGRWRYTVVHGLRRFRFPAATIGEGARDELGYIAFPVGSEAAAQGASGPYAAPPESEPAGPDGVLPPEVMLPPKDEDDGGFAFWIPLAGLTLAGVGGLVVVRRRRH